MSWISLKVLFNSYPYRYYDPLKSKHNSPYISKKIDNPNHPYSVTYEEFLKICKTYFKYVRQYLLQGDTYKFPHGIGVLTIRKFRNKSSNYWWKFVYNYEEKKRERIRMKNTHTREFTLRLNWLRMGVCKFKWQSLYRVKPSKELRIEMANTIKNDLTNINNFIKW